MWTLCIEEYLKRHTQSWWSLGGLVCGCYYTSPLLCVHIFCYFWNEHKKSSFVDLKKKKRKRKENDFPFFVLSGVDSFIRVFNISEVVIVKWLRVVGGQEKTNKKEVYGHLSEMRRTSRCTKAKLWEKREKPCTRMKWDVLLRFTVTLSWVSLLKDPKCPVLMMTAQWEDGGEMRSNQDSLSRMNKLRHWPLKGHWGPGRGDSKSLYIENALPLQNKKNI